MKKSTINDEVTNDLVNYFQEDKQFKEYEIIVLGHSSDLIYRPRVHTNQISKIIFLAGNTLSLEVPLPNNMVIYKTKSNARITEAVK
jgi:hypothetical protein